MAIPFDELAAELNDHVADINKAVRETGGVRRDYALALLALKIALEHTRTLTAIVVELSYLRHSYQEAHP